MVSPAPPPAPINRGKSLYSRSTQLYWSFIGRMVFEMLSGYFMWSGKKRFSSYKNFKQIFREVNSENLVGAVILNYRGRAYVWQILYK